MEYQNFNAPKLYLILCLLAGMVALHSPHADGMSLHDNSSPPEGTMKTIEGDNGELVDCVDIYKQPAFNNPLLKDHKIRMDQTSYPNKMKRSNSTLKLRQPWHKNGMCSQGTIPIVRRRRLQSTPIKGPHFEYATIHTFAPKGTRFNGGYGNLSIWNPFVANAEDQSSSSLLVSIDSGSTFLMAGWIVDFELYHDYQTRLFMYSEINNSSCWDLDCDGFVQFSNTVALGSPITTISTLDSSTQFIFEIVIYRSENTGDWVLRVQGDVIGYWPASLFDGIPLGAESLRWGGVIYDSVGGSEHTTTDMGNGLFPDTGSIKSSYVCDLAYIDESFNAHYTDRSMLQLGITNPSCYDGTFFVDSLGNPCFLFGGPGKNPQCP